MTKATASELHRLAEIDRADALLRAWVAGAALCRREFRAGRLTGPVKQMLGWESYWLAVEDGAVVAAGYSTRGLLAAMVDCAARLEPAFRAAETLPAPADDEAPAVTIPAPAPTGAGPLGDRDA